MNQKNITIALLDNNDLLREGLTALINAESGFTCVGAWSDPAEALDSLARNPADILLVDIKLPERAGFDILRRISERDIHCRVIVTVGCSEERCIVLNPVINGAVSRTTPVSSLYSAPDDCLQIALKMGAQGVLRKRCSFRYIAQAIRAVYMGQYWMELPTANRLAEQYLHSMKSASPDQGGGASLTLRERQVVRLLAHGRSNKEIARELGLAYSTVKNYVSSILEKLGLSDRTQIALYAIDQGAEQVHSSVDNT